MKNTAIIIRDKEVIEKIDQLKKLFNYKTRTKFINFLIEKEYLKCSDLFE